MRYRITRRRSNTPGRLSGDRLCLRHSDYRVGCWSLNHSGHLRSLAERKPTNAKAVFDDHHDCTGDEIV
jgi:hypothetical protein